jgi:hypothetical protein
MSSIKCSGKSARFVDLTLNGVDKSGGCAGLAQDAKENDGESVESAIGIKLGFFWRVHRFSKNGGCAGLT